MPQFDIFYKKRYIYTSKYKYKARRDIFGANLWKKNNIFHS